MGSAGRAVGWLQLAGGVGDYVVRVFARNRREVNRLYNELFERGVRPAQRRVPAGAQEPRGPRAVPAAAVARALTPAARPGRA